MRYHECAPPDAASDYVEALWVFDVAGLRDDAPRHIIVPDGTISLALIRLPGGPVHLSFSGPAPRAHQVELLNNAVYGGVRLLPGAAGSVLKTNIEPYVSAFGPHIKPRPLILNQLQSLIPPSADRSQIEGLLKKMALFVAAQAASPDETVCVLAAALAQAQGAQSISAFAQDRHISERQLRRRFKYQCGLTPKTFARLRRVRGACIDMVSTGRVDLAATSIKAGFCDQPHMGREFQSVFDGSAGMVNAYLRQIKHGSLM
ncbi:MAG: helix-turn-helix domain-containing protein [Pseudomonadota bacterium]